jgi:hypothetical protein
VQGEKTTYMSNQNSNNARYPIKLWLISTAIVAPVLLSLGASVYHSGYFERGNSFGVILLFIAFGLLLSAPTFLIMVVVFMELRKRIKSIPLLKITTNFVAIIGVFITFALLKINENKALYISVYCLSIILSSIFLPLRQRSAETSSKAAP